MVAVRIRGWTALELLIVTSAVAIIAAFAGPVIDDAVLSSELKEAIEITESAVLQARQTARIYHTDVLLQVGEQGAQDRQVLTLVIPRMQKDITMNEVVVKFVLPDGVQAVSQEEVIHFMPNGEVEPPSETLTVLDQVHSQSRQLALVGERTNENW